MGRSLAATLYTLLGFAAILGAISLLPSAVRTLLWDRPVRFPSYWRLNVLLSTGLPGLLLLGGGSFLILRSRRLAARYDGGAGEYVVAGSPAQLHASFVSAVGLLLIGLGLHAWPEAAADVFLALRARQEDRVPHKAPLTLWTSAAGVLLELGLGLFLVARSTALVTLLQRRRDRTRPQAVDAQCPHCGYWIAAGSYRPDAPAYRCDNCKGEIPSDLVRTVDETQGREREAGGTPPRHGSS